MNRFLVALLLVTLSTAPWAQEPAAQKQSNRRGSVAGYTSRDATVLSMMGWGLTIAVGIATLCALIEKNGATSHASSSH